MATFTAVIFSAILSVFALTTLAPIAHGQANPGAQVARRREPMHTSGLFLGVGGGQTTLDSDALLPPDDGLIALSGRVGYGFGDYVTLVVSGDLTRVDLTLDSSESEFEFAHIALSARIHPFRTWGRVGPFIEGSWLRYAATTDRVVSPATVATRLTLEGTGAAAGAGLHVFMTRALSLEASAALTDGKFTKATGAGASGAFDDIPLRSRLYRIGLTWWLGS